jgi:hypothetical protein
MRSNHLAILVAAAAALWLAPDRAHARGWQGVIPGTTTETEITNKFGPPSTQGRLGGRNALVYKGDQAITGTRQAQFFTREDGVVSEVVVFPANQLDKETVDGTYGHPTHKAFTDDFRNVWFFKPSGITVYFGKDGFVDAISFKVPEGAKAEQSRASAPPATPPLKLAPPPPSTPPPRAEANP